MYNQITKKMEIKHTKGEWETVNRFHVATASKPLFSQSPIHKTKEEAEANAKLIAAAPELLEALIELTNQIKNEHCSEFMDEPFNKAINAINKATK